MEFSQLNYSRHSYLDTSELNTVEVWRSHATHVPEDGQKFWVIFVHGGAWRDPEVDSKSFEPSVRVLCQSHLMDSIAGFASINYRLSPYPTHPRAPSSPEDPGRNVQHPSHMIDVTNALFYLDENYQIGTQYLLVGHSAGATIAFQLRDRYLRGRRIPRPKCVLGVSGIYNFEAFVEAHIRYPVYEEIMLNAFPDRKSWKDDAPYTDPITDEALWQHVKAVFISHSDADELVETGQASLMLERAKEVAGLKGKVHYLQATGAHDEIWQSGHILAGLIIKAVEILRSGNDQ